jgi:hypothetical protein
MEFITPFISGITILSQTQPGIHLEVTGLITLSQAQAYTSISFG